MSGPTWHLFTPSPALVETYDDRPPLRPITQYCLCQLPKQHPIHTCPTCGGSKYLWKRTTSTKAEYRVPCHVCNPADDLGLFGP